VHVVATAGHVDHGKSTLVEALTGQQPDRLEEEQRRGLSIQLGYCWTTSPAVGEIAFVDVPGHERFLTTTLSGLGPVPVAMLVVAADDPWMPQAAEHLAALDALGVRHGLLVVTRSDLADPGPALDRGRRELSSTSLADAPAVVVSGRTGAGIDELRATLDDVLSSVPAPDPGATVRLWVDRRFHVRGAGTVVTGTLPAGAIAPGDRLSYGAGSVRVRGLESLGVAREKLTGTARVAVDLAGDVPEAIGRGTVLTTVGAFAEVEVVDVRLRVPHGAPGAAVRAPGRVPERLLLHVGSAALDVHVRPLGEHHVRVTLPGPLPLRLGDRGVLRDPGSRALWGAEVIDCDPPRLTRRGAARLRASELAEWDGSAADLVRSRGVVSTELLDRIGVTDGSTEDGTVSARGWLLSAERADRARVALHELVDGAGDEGLSLGALARQLQLPEVLVPALVEPPLRLEGGRVRPGQVAELPARVRDAVVVVRADLEAAPFAAPDAGRLRELGLDERAVTLLHRRGQLLHVGSSVVLLPDAPDEAVRRLAALPQPFTTSEARQALQTSRRVVLPLLAHLDRTGRTLRLPDDRRRLR
jgi:selenocysteine-specific elongation factor